MRKWQTSCVVGLTILLLILAACAPKPAPVAPAAKAPSPLEEAAKFYKGATMKFIVPYEPGGTYDLWARLLVPYLEAHTGSVVVVENMPGAAGLVGGGHLYNVAKPDGLTIAIMPMPGMVLAEMLGFEAVKYELGKFSYVGRVEVMWRALFASKASGFNSIADMQKAPKTIRFGTVDPTSQSSVEEALLAEAFGLKAKIVPGYKGSREYMLAAIAGKEVDAASTSLAGYEGMVRARELTLVAHLGKQRHPDFRDVPTALETPGLSAEGKKLLDLLTILVDSGRMIVAPPGTPEARLLFLEKALQESQDEPGLKEFAAKRGLEVSPLSAKESKALIAKLLEIVPPAERAKLKHIVTVKYF